MDKLIEQADAIVKNLNFSDSNAKLESKTFLEWHEKHSLFRLNKIKPVYKIQTGTEWGNIKFVYVRDGNVWFAHELYGFAECGAGLTRKEACIDLMKKVANQLEWELIEEKLKSCKKKE